MTLETITWISAGGIEVPLYTDGIRTRPGLKGRMMPSIRKSSFVVPGYPGQITTDVQHGTRDVVVPIYVEGGTMSEYRAVLRAIADSLDPVPGDGVLRISDPDGAERDLVCSYVDGFNFEEEWPSPASTPTLLFEADDPYWYDAAPTQITWTVGTPATFFPLFPIRLSSSEVFADATIDNNGSVSTWPVWTVTGPGSGLVLRNVTTGKSLSVVRTLGAGESISVDTRRGAKSIRDGAGANLWPVSSGSLWPLEKGSQAVRVEFTGATPASRVTLRWWRRFLSA